MWKERKETDYFFTWGCVNVVPFVASLWPKRGSKLFLASCSFSVFVLKLGDHPGSVVQSMQIVALAD